MPTRSVTVMCLIQLILLLMAWVLSSKLVRVGLEHSEAFLQSRDVSGLVHFRDFGLVALIIPVIIATVCTRLTKLHRDIAILGSDGFGLAIISTLAVAFFSSSVVIASMKVAFFPGK